MNRAIILAAGLSTRMGSVNKLLIEYRNRPIVASSVEAFLRAKEIEDVMVVYRDEAVKDALREYPVHFVKGASTRTESFYCALSLCADDDFLLIHDGARPFINDEDIKKCLSCAKKGEAFVLGTAVVDTIKEIQGEYVKQTLERDRLIQAMTPQGGFARDFRRAQQMGLEGSDDASLLEGLGVPVRLILGSRDNIKITHPEDLRKL